MQFSYSFCRAALLVNTFLLLLSVQQVSFAQAAHARPSSALDWMDATLVQLANGLRQQANQPDCSGCSEIIRQLDQVEDLRRVMRKDMDQWMRRYATGFSSGDSSVLLGRYPLEEGQLPLKDFLEACQRQWPSEDNAAQALPSWQPGRYTQHQIFAMQLEMEAMAAFKLQALLHAFQSKLAASLPQPVLIAPAALNVLYTGVDNPLRVYGGTADPATVRLEGPGVHFDEASGQWLAKPTNPGPVEIRLTGLAPGGRAVQGSATFEARRVPEPLIYIGGRSDGVLVQRDINGQTGIAARNDDFLFAAGYTIRGFELVYTPEYGSPVLAKTPGNKFTDEMMAVFKRTKPGDRLLFRVAVEYPDGSIKTLSPTFYLR
ncbi:MAG: hypothetical protein GC205_02935 [Bacteroidetes bacterium]|nr:hypothetical protein [Bacteroidota bacterium]